MRDRSRSRLPELSGTGRWYVEQTARARLASPGIERYRRRSAVARTVVLAIALAALLVAALRWVS